MAYTWYWVWLDTVTGDEALGVASDNASLTDTLLLSFYLNLNGKLVEHFLSYPQQLLEVGYQLMIHFVC